jgi:hypothetical protein
VNAPLPGCLSHPVLSDKQLLSEDSIAINIDDERLAAIFSELDAIVMVPAKSRVAGLLLEALALTAANIDLSVTLNSHEKLVGKRRVITAGCAGGLDEVLVDMPTKPDTGVASVAGSETGQRAEPVLFASRHYPSTCEIVRR